MLYEIKVSHTDLEDGKIKKTHFITDAELHGEAETTGYEQYGAAEQPDVFAVFRSDIREIINDKEDDKPFFRAVVVEVSTDDSGKEHEQKYPMLVCAKDIAEATHLVEQHLQQGYYMRLDALRRVKIADYIKKD